MTAMDFEKNQIKNFMKQKIQLERQNKTTGNKFNKKGDFEETASIILQALGIIPLNIFLVPKETQHIVFSLTF